MPTDFVFPHGNEDEFIEVYRFGIRNINFVRQIRLRNVSEIGVYKGGNA